jgi:hypothetical protein
VHVCREGHGRRVHSSPANCAALWLLGCFLPLKSCMTSWRGCTIGSRVSVPAKEDYDDDNGGDRVIMMMVMMMWTCDYAVKAERGVQECTGARFDPRAAGNEKTAS